MNEVKYSPILSEIIEEAKKIGYKKNSPLTAEKFILALINKAISGDFDEDAKELRIAIAAIKKDFDDIKDARDALNTYINRENASTFLDDLYMKKKISEAQMLAKKDSSCQIDCSMLVYCILNDPYGMIEQLLASNKNTETSEQTNDDQDIVAGFDLDELMSYIPPTEEDHDDDQPFSDEKTPVDVKAEMSKLVEDIKRIRNELKSAVYGQDNAINVFLTGYFQAILMSMIDKKKKRPRATFLFAGPPGVGKTFLAEKAAESLGLPYVRFDMSEYCDKEAAIEFCGSDGVYKNSKQGNFTEFISKNPKCVVLLDEIEKAHISIIHLFLQVLDAGRIRDNQTDVEIPMKDVILIFTTNAGKQLYSEYEDGDLSTVSRKVIIDALEKDADPRTGIPYFPGAICSRFASGNVVMFNHIAAHDLRLIAKREIERHAENLKTETGISLKIDEAVYTALLFSEGSKADARTTRSRAEAFFNDELYELFRLVSSGKAETDVNDIEEIEISVDLEGAPVSVASLFDNKDEKQVLILSAEDTVKLCTNGNSGCEFIAAQTCEDAINTIKAKDIGLLILDVSFGMDGTREETLNIEDINTPARELLKFLKEHKNTIPVYLLEGGNSLISDEERISFLRQGIRGFLKVADGEQSIFAENLDRILEILHQQSSMIKLSSENKLVSFDTSQSMSSDGKNATIKLFDFRTTVAVDSEDSKNILDAVSRPNVRFDDVIGAGDAKRELKSFVDYLKNPKKFLGTGVKAPKGILLYGPPGTGKTMLAKAIASEAGVTFIASEGNQFLKKYVGEGAEAVHELFKTARKYAPSILFIDEIDAIGKERRGGDNAVGEETLTAFLTEMDGFANNASKPVFVLAATNFDVEPGRSKSLDPALMRRFDRRIYIELPSKEDRIKFLKMKIAKNSALKITDSTVENIAIRSTGMSLAELDSAIELALRSAIREGSTVVTDAILEEAFETFNSGEVKKWDASLLERVARHEAGHALLCWLSGETPSYITIVARGNHGGYVLPAEQEGKALYTADELLARIRTSLAGRASEIVYYGKRDGFSTGASGDLSSATNVAKHMVCSYGMDGEFGLAVVPDTGEMSPEVRSAVNRILSEQMEKTIGLIEMNKDKIDALVKVLMDKNYLNGTQIGEIFSNGMMC